MLTVLAEGQNRGNKKCVGTHFRYTNCFYRGFKARDMPYTSPTIYDFRPKRRKYRTGYHFDKEFIAAFSRQVAGSLLYQSVAYHYRARCRADDAQYHPVSNMIEIHSRWCDKYDPVDPGLDVQTDLGIDFFGALEVPKEAQFLLGRDRDRFCELVAERYTSALQPANDPRLPDFIVTHPSYLKAAEKLIEATGEEWRWQLPAQLQVDIECLCIETQALLVESRLNHD
jgi:hypothetical protein